MTMKYRVLGRTGLEVSVAGLGSLGYLRGDCSQSQVTAMIEHARLAGINFLDTAYGYGLGKIDKMVGKAIEQHRDHWTILSRSHRRDPQEFKDSLEETFNNLRTDVIDIFQLHDITDPADYEAAKQPGGTYDIARQAQRDGHIRFLGISTHADVDIVRDMIESDRFDVITISYNVANCKRQHADGEDLQQVAEEILPLAYSRGIGITVMKPYGGGSLLQAFPGPDGSQITLSPVQLMRFCIANPNVATVTPGVESIEQVDAVIQAGQAGEAMSMAEIEQLKRQAHVWGRDFCRRCGYCLPCPEGIVIPAAMKALDKFKMGQTADGRKNYDSLDPRPENCTSCGTCVDRCPYSLPIPEKLQQLTSFAKTEEK